MKKDTHPKYHSKAKIVCACGNEMIIGSTKEKIDVELCHLCHPFYTGQQKLVDTAGVVDRFREKLAKHEAKSKTVKNKKAKKAARAQKKSSPKDK